MSGGRREPRLLLRRRELEMPRADVGGALALVGIKLELCQPTYLDSRGLLIIHGLLSMW
jgi:hypothetical protein